MNMQLTAIYYCATNRNSWGKGLTIEAAKANARLPKNTKGIEYYVQAVVLNGEGITDEELENLRQCVTAHPIDGSAMYYTDYRTQEDTDMIEKYHVGWLTVEKNY